MLIGIILLILTGLCMYINQQVFEAYCRKEEEYFIKKYEQIQKDRFLN